MAAVKNITMSFAKFEQHAKVYDGICMACGTINDDFTEPDAQDCPCPKCGENEVMGMELALELDKITIS